MEENDFKWGDKIYKDPLVLPTGGPLSALISEIYLHNFESSRLSNEKKSLLSQSYLSQQICDDNFMIMTSTKRQASPLNHLTKINKTIKIKLEIEENTSIPFLDVIVIKNKDKPKCCVYRKPTQTELVIPKNSNHPS